jgi:hypothetical protein
MGLNCGCPQGAHIADLVIPECKESLGQVQKVIFQRVFKSTGELNGIAVDSGSSTIGKLATWTALTTASDGTKMTVSPFLQGPSTEPGAARTFGGGNQTLNGIEIIVGREPTSFSATFYEESQAVIAAMKGYMCENIGVMLIDNGGNIACLADDPASPKKLMPIPIDKLFIGDKKLGGLEEPDSNAIEWSFKPNWSDGLYIIKRTELEFDPLTALVNVKSV